jgi:hypothetical protein
VFFFVPSIIAVISIPSIFSSSEMATVNERYHRTVLVLDTELVSVLLALLFFPCPYSTV